MGYLALFCKKRSQLYQRGELHSVLSPISRRSSHFCKQRIVFHLESFKLTKVSSSKMHAVEKSLFFTQVPFSCRFPSLFPASVSSMWMEKPSQSSPRRPTRLRILEAIRLLKNCFSPVRTIRRTRN